MHKNELETYCPKHPEEWRNWLSLHHQSKSSIWLIYYKVSTKITSLRWSEAVDEALCFGWIDSTKKTLDQESYMQYFCKRKAGSTWSKINKEKVNKLIQQKRMAKAGFDSIETAKKNGTWTLLDDVEKLILPEDLRIALNAYEHSLDFFQHQPTSIKKAMLYWIVIAKKAATRQKRITEIARLAAKGVRPRQFR